MNERLKQLLRSPDWTESDEQWVLGLESPLRQTIGVSSNTPTGVLVDLSFDVDLAVRMAVAANPNTPIETLQRLAAQDSAPEVQVAANQNLKGRGA